MSDLTKKIEELYEEFFPQWQNADGADINFGYLTGVIDILGHLQNVIAENDPTEIPDPTTIKIVWSYEDVQALSPDLSDQEALEVFNKISRSLKDRSIEEGWEILKTLLELHEYTLG